VNMYLSETAFGTASSGEAHSDVGLAQTAPIDCSFLTALGTLAAPERTCVE
jgi:hypothetical protein